MAAGLPETGVTYPCKFAVHMCSNVPGITVFRKFVLPRQTKRTTARTIRVCVCDAGNRATYTRRNFRRAEEAGHNNDEESVSPWMSFGAGRIPAWLPAAVILLGSLLTQAVFAQTSGPEGKVKFFVVANSSFDQWTSNPTPSQQQFMREHYHRMLTYSPYFDSRLSWYPNGWEYEDAYAIYRSSSVARDHPEWILRDANGQELYIPFGCSGGTCPQYAADIGNPGFQDYYIENERARLAAGYRGIFVDDVNLSNISVGNGNGDQVTPIDPRTGSEMTLQGWRRYFADFVEKVRAAFPAHEISHNVHWWADRGDPSVVRALDAADWINLERGVTDSGIRGGTGTYGFETFLGFIDWLHARGKHVIMEDDDDTGLQERDYELAFYLLINDGKGDMVAADGDHSRMNPDQFWSGYLTNLGYATNTHYRWNDLFRRDFECGLVLVNQPDMRGISVSLDGDFINLDGGTVSSVAIPSSGGVVLKRVSCEPSMGLAPRPPTNLRVEQ